MQGLLRLGPSWGKLAELHEIHARGGSRILDALKQGGKLGVGSDLGREVGHDGAFPHLGDGQQGSYRPHGRALQFILLFKLLLHGAGLDLKWEAREGEE